MCENKNEVKHAVPNLMPKTVVNKPLLKTAVKNQRQPN
jgi:hypothetical protein